MPTSLMDMFGGNAPLQFSPRDYAGNQIGMGDAIAQNSNSLVGLGMGLLQPYRPGESPYAGALQGYQAGSVADSNRGYRTAQLQHQQRQEAFQRSQAGQQQSNWERQFERSDPAKQQTDYQRALRDLYPDGATPEQKAELARQIWLPKTEGSLVAQAEQRRTIAKAQGLDENDPKVKGWIAGGGTLNEKPRDMSVTDITKLSEEGGKLANVSTFSNTFEPRFAGYKSSAVGSIANLAGRNLPEGVVGKDVAEGATWWQGYDRYKNVIRNELYGSALTPSEQAAFEAADITPGMDPKQIQNNLATQKTIAEAGLRRKANAMIAAGYDPKTISQAYGVDLKALGVTATGRGGGAAPAGPTPAVSGPAAAPSGAPMPTAGRGGSAPPRPANVPAGSAYSPSRNQWKLPDGTIVDAAGKPI